jgi:2-methylcitrate dehydratase PrpD
MAQSREQASFISEIVVRFSRQTRDIYGKRISKRSTESRGFSPGTSVSSHKEC